MDRYVYQPIILDETYTKDFMSRFGIYDSLEEAKFAVEYTFLDDEYTIDEIYIEKILVGSMPDKGQRQGIKVCYLDSNDQWQWYKNYSE